MKINLSLWSVTVGMLFTVQMGASAAHASPWQDIKNLFNFRNDGLCSIAKKANDGSDVKGSQKYKDQFAACTSDFKPQDPNLCLNAPGATEAVFEKALSNLDKNQYAKTMCCEVTQQEGYSQVSCQSMMTVWANTAEGNQFNTPERLNDLKKMVATVSPDQATSLYPVVNNLYFYADQSAAIEFGSVLLNAKVPAQNLNFSPLDWTTPGAIDFLTKALTLGVSPSVAFPHSLATPDAYTLLNAANQANPDNFPTLEAYVENSYHVETPQVVNPLATQWAIDHGASSIDLINAAIDSGSIDNLTSVDSVIHYPFTGDQMVRAAQASDPTFQVLAYVVAHSTNDQVSGYYYSSTTALSSLLVNPSIPLPIIKTLIAKEPDLTVSVYSGYTAATYLSLAAAQGSTQVVQALIDAKAPVDQLFDLSGSVGFDALYSAVSAKQDANALLLIQYSSDVAKSYVNNETAFSLAVANGMSDVVEALLESGQYVNQLTDKGLSPVMVAAQTANAPSLAIILKKPYANLEIKDLSGETALYYAVNSGSLANVQALIAAGANVNVTDTNGKTPLAIAMTLTNSDIVNALKIAMGLPATPVAPVTPVPVATATPSPTPSSGQ